MPSRHTGVLLSNTTCGFKLPWRYGAISPRRPSVDRTPPRYYEVPPSCTTHVRRGNGISQSAQMWGTNRPCRRWERWRTCGGSGDRRARSSRYVPISCFRQCDLGRFVLRSKPSNSPKQWDTMSSLLTIDVHLSNYVPTCRSTYSQISS